MLLSEIIKNRLYESWITDIEHKVKTFEDNGIDVMAFHDTEDVERDYLSGQSIYFLGSQETLDTVINVCHKSRFPIDAVVSYQYYSTVHPEGPKEWRIVFRYPEYPVFADQWLREIDKKSAPQN